MEFTWVTPPGSALRPYSPVVIEVDAVVGAMVVVRFEDDRRFVAFSNGTFSTGFKERSRRSMRDEVHVISIIPDDGWIPTEETRITAGALGVGGGGMVSSVFGRQGDVVAQPGDYSMAQIPNTSALAGANLKLALDGAKTLLDSLQSQINALPDPGEAGVSQEDFDVLEGTVGTLQSALTTAQSNITTLQSQMTTKAAQSALTTLSSTVSALQDTVSTLSTAVSGKASQSELNMLTTTVGTKAAQSALDTLQGLVTTAQSDITTLQGQAATFATQDYVDDQIAAIPGGGGGGAEAPFCGYSGYTVSAVGAAPTSWTDFVSATGITVQDEFQEGVTRSGSTFTFSKAGYYRLSVFLNAGGYDTFYGYRWRRAGVTLAQRTTYSGIGSGLSFGQAPTMFDALLLIEAGDVLTLQTVRKTGPGATWGTTNTPIDGESMRTGNIAIARVGITVGVGWKTAMDVNFAQEPARSFVDGANAWNGKTWTGANIASALSSFVITPGTGAVATHNATLSELFTLSPFNTAALLYIKLPDLIPGFVLGQTRLRITAELSSTANKNHESARIAICKLPWVYEAVALWELRQGYWDNSGPRAAGLVLYGGNGGSPPNRSDWAAGSTAGGANNILSMYFDGVHEALFYKATSSAVSGDSNDVAIVPRSLELGGVWRPQTAALGQATLGTQTIVTKADDLVLALVSSQQNTSGTMVSTFKRLRVEYML